GIRVTLASLGNRPACLVEEEKVDRTVVITAAVACGTRVACIQRRVIPIGVGRGSRAGVGVAVGVEVDRPAGQAALAGVASAVAVCVVGDGAGDWAGFDQGGATDRAGRGDNGIGADGQGVGGGRGVDAGGGV